MIFKLHYWFLASGANAIGILLGVFMEAYTDANSTEIGMLYMMMPFIGIIFRPLICSQADRKQAHQKYLMICLLVVSISYAPFVIIPLLGPQVYDVHPRLCFYTLVALKVVGDAAFGGVISIGDSLAINYAKRIGVDFSVYRVWGTISWMVFGLIIGQINEIWFLPKYVPGFIVLIISSLSNMFVIYLWPKEYFRMVTHSDEPGASGDEKKDGDWSKKSALTKSLLPREVVFAHAKKQLWLLITFRCMANKAEESENSTEDIERVKSRQTGNYSNELKSNDISKRTQLKILTLLIKRDPRIIFYLLLFICAGFSVVPISFLFISLAKICHEGGKCDFSQLGGLLQVSMALAETFLFIYIKRIIATIGRLSTISISYFLTAAKFTFYGTIWLNVDPHYSLVVELAHGIIFGIYVTLMVEMGHLFASEVEYVIPELLEKEIIPKDADREKLKLSLLATMQAIIANANDGIGRGIGALIYGLILDHYTFQVLWRCIAIGSILVFASVHVANLIDHLVGFDFGNRLKRVNNLTLATQEAGRVENAETAKDTFKVHEDRDIVV